MRGLWLADARAWPEVGEELLSEGLTRLERKQRKRQRVEPSAEPSAEPKERRSTEPESYDCVLVDAECAHDASFESTVILFAFAGIGCSR